MGAMESRARRDPRRFRWRRPRTNSWIIVRHVSPSSILPAYLQRFPWTGSRQKRRKLPGLKISDGKLGWRITRVNTFCPAFCLGSRAFAERLPSDDNSINGRSIHSPAGLAGYSIPRRLFTKRQPAAVAPLANTARVFPRSAENPSEREAAMQDRQGLSPAMRPARRSVLEPKG